MRQPPLTDEQIMTMGRLYGKMPTLELVELLGVPASKIERVAGTLRKKGVKVATFKNMGGIDRIAQILKREQGK